MSARAAPKWLCKNDLLLEKVIFVALNGMCSISDHLWYTHFASKAIKRYTTEYKLSIEKCNNNWEKSLLPIREAILYKNNPVVVVNMIHDYFITPLSCIPNETFGFAKKQTCISEMIQYFEGLLRKHLVGKWITLRTVM